MAKAKPSKTSESKPSSVRSLLQTTPFSVSFTLHPVTLVDVNGDGSQYDAELIAVMNPPNLLASSVNFLVEPKTMLDGELVAVPFDLVDEQTEGNEWKAQISLYPTPAPTPAMSSSIEVTVTVRKSRKRTATRPEIL